MFPMRNSADFKPPHLPLPSISSSICCIKDTCDCYDDFPIPRFWCRMYCFKTELLDEDFDVWGLHISLGSMSQTWSASMFLLFKQWRPTNFFYPCKIKRLSAIVIRIETNSNQQIKKQHRTKKRHGPSQKNAKNTKNKEKKQQTRRTQLEGKVTESWVHVKFSK